MYNNMKKYIEYNFKNYLNNTRITLISILWSVLATATDFT